MWLCGPEACSVPPGSVRKLVLHNSLMGFAEALPVTVRTTRASPASTVLPAGELVRGSLSSTGPQASLAFTAPLWKG